MQLYAFDSKDQLISAREASRQTDYYCLECQQVVRLRGGPHRQWHFYHLDPTPFCRQHQKGAVHLQLQSYFLQRLPLGDCQLECSFPSIRRIADVAWLSQKIIFEIQCSPITSQEILERNRDYQRLGWQVVWILHDQRYNQMRLSAAEMALRSSPHFFTNINQSGVGEIYDQFDVCEKGIRLKRLPSLPIDIREIQIIDEIVRKPFPLTLLEQRAQTWKFSFSGDLIDLFLKDPHSDYLYQAAELEKAFRPQSNALVLSHLPLMLWQKGVVAPYQIVFRFLLERMCR